MFMEMNYVNNCISLGVRPLNWSSDSHHNPRKKRSKFIKIAASHRPVASNPKPGPCTECGKRFESSKALFGHMRCHPERQWRGINPPPNVHQAPPETASAVTEEDHEAATYLLILANGPAPNKPRSAGTGTTECLNDEVGSSSGFECSSCKKVFGSHQALGGHRASHKNVKGCYANTKTYHGHEQEHEGCRCVGHKCSVCSRVFSSGQALGGHKKCHCSRVCGLDLNFPAAPPVEDVAAVSTSRLALDLRLGL